MKAGDEFELLSGLTGRVACRIRRICYVFKGEVTSCAGPIELCFTDGSVVLLDAGPDGEALTVKAAAWTDHFAEPLSRENMEFVEKSGKWAAFDVSAQKSYSRFIGEWIRQVTPIRTLENKITGVTLATLPSTLRVEIEGDEVTVDIA